MSTTELQQGQGTPVVGTLDQWKGTRPIDKLNATKGDGQRPQRPQRQVVEGEAVDKSIKKLGVRVDVVTVMAPHSVVVVSVHVFNTE